MTSLTFLYQLLDRFVQQKNNIPQLRPLLRKTEKEEQEMTCIGSSAEAFNNLIGLFSIGNQSTRKAGNMLLRLSFEYFRIDTFPLFRTGLNSLHIGIGQNLALIPHFLDYEFWKSPNNKILQQYFQQRNTQGAMC